MKLKNKESYMDCVTAIFVRTALLKYPTREEYTRRIREDVYKRLATLNPQIIVARADGSVSASKPIIEDLDAVEKTFQNLAERNKEYIINAVKAIYFPYGGTTKIPNKIIKERILAFATDFHADERTVYRWLKEARMICAFYRGITINEPEIV